MNVGGDDASPLRRVRKLTKSFVDELKPDPDPKKRLTWWDSEVKGFGITVTPPAKLGGEVKSYIFQYRMGGRAGKTRRVTIGRHGREWQPHTARDQAAELARMVRQGIDPFEERKRNIEEQNRKFMAEWEESGKAMRLAYPSIRETYVEEYAKPHQPRSWRNTEYALKGLDHYFSRSRVDQITRDRINTVLTGMVTKQNASAAIAAHKALRRMFRWLVAEEHIASSPMIDMKPPAKVKVRTRVLTPSELKEVWDAAATLAYPFGYMVHGLILSGQRLREIAEGEWSEIKAAQNVFLIPALRMKREEGDQRGDHVVPLNARALALMTGLPKISPGLSPDGKPLPARFLFTSNGKKPVSGFSAARVLLDEAICAARKKRAGDAWDDSMDMPHWTFHDLRRTLSTSLQALGVAPAIIDRIQDHVPAGQSKISRAYQHWDYFEEKKAAVDLWGQFLDGAVFGDQKQKRLVEKVAFRLLVNE
jgi:integrase